MLIELHIQDFAIIENLDLQLTSGLIAFTGETGAGKSIMIDAIDTLLGGRAEAIQVRSGEDRANIEAVFTIPECSRPHLLQVLEKEDLLDDPEHITLARELRRNGRNIARINGRSVSTSMLREISSALIDIHGQSEHLSLLRVGSHIDLLDRFAALQPESKLTDTLKSYSEMYHQVKVLRQELETLRAVEKEAALKEDILKFQINEIEAAHLHVDEDSHLSAERNRLANAETLARSAQEALISLDEGSSESPAASDLIGRALGDISTLSKLDPLQEKLSENAQLLFESLSDLVRNLRIYLDSIEFNPKRLDAVEERLASIRLLERKYGDSINAILLFLEKAKSQLDQVSHVEERIADLETRINSLLMNLGNEGAILTEERQKAAQKLGEWVENELMDLQMAGARFRVDFQKFEDQNGAFGADGSRLAFYPNGLDKIEFLIAPNPGEGFKPLVKIASGGETSRLMLALKNVLAQADQIPTLIFDEIDQGVGGRVGAIVGQKLWNLARQHQVLCITHLPQLAAFGDQHFHIEKEVDHGRTTTVVKQIQGDERVLELAAMLGGSGMATRKSAEELLQTAKTYQSAS